MPLLREAYAGAGTFVTVVDESRSSTAGSLCRTRPDREIRSGWGRITRTLLTKAAAIKLYALDNERTRAGEHHAARGERPDHLS
jgi:hypothetical protein